MAEAKSIFQPQGHILGKGTAVIDLTQTVTNGSVPSPSQWGSWNYYTKLKMHAVLLQAPKGLRYVPNGDDLARQLKSMIEVHVREITGVNTGTEVESTDIIVGNNQAMTMAVPTKVNMGRSTPNFVYNEFMGKPIMSLHRIWQEDLIMDPGTNHPGLIRYDAYQAAGSPPITVADYTAVVLFVEPNKELTGVVDYALCANMYPGNLESTMTKAMGQPNETQELTIEYQAITLRNNFVRNMALQYIQSINRDGFSMTGLAPFVSEIAPSLRDEALKTVFGGNRKYVQAVAEQVAASGVGN